MELLTGPASYGNGEDPKRNYVTAFGTEPGGLGKWGDSVDRTGHKVGLNWVHLDNWRERENEGRQSGWTSLRKECR